MPRIGPTGRAAPRSTQLPGRPGPVAGQLPKRIEVLLAGAEEAVQVAARRRLGGGGCSPAGPSATAVPSGSRTRMRSPAAARARNWSRLACSWSRSMVAAGPARYRAADDGGSRDGRPTDRQPGTPGDQLHTSAARRKSTSSWLSTSAVGTAGGRTRALTAP